ncbi:MAG: hypothetical protein JNM93_13355 [Bacteriovoracaceae bacterium]|nr:hypothetical protein [Bacteriovoracaceae bacterium]
MKLLLLLSVFTFYFINSSVHICEHGQEVAENESSLCTEHQEHETSSNQHNSSCIGCCFNHYFQTAQAPSISYEINLIGTAQFHFITESPQNYQINLLRPPIA